MQTPAHLPTLADLVDHTASARARLPEAVRLGGALKRQLATVCEDLALAQSSQDDARAQTAAFEAKMRKADEKHRVIAAAEYGAHTVRVADLEAKYEAAKLSADVRISELEKDIADNVGYVKAIESSIKSGKARNAVQLYAAVATYCNLIGHARYAADKLFEAGHTLHNRSKSPMLIDPEASRMIGPFEARIDGRYERFDEFYDPKPEPPVDETQFNNLWKEIGQ